MEMLARKLRTLRAERIVEVTPSGRQGRDPGDEAAGQGTLTRNWAIALPLAWAAIYATAVAVTPPPAHPNAPEPAIGVVLETLLLWAWTAMAIGVVGRRAMGAWASLAAGGVMLAQAITCPVIGHHESVGLWWFYELAGAAVLIALSLRAIPRRRTDR